MNRKILSDGRKSNGSQAAPDETGFVEMDDPPRRALLRGALAAGCSLFIPAALLGCDAGKGTDAADSDGAVPMADPASAGLPEQASEKVSQASVQYQSQPQGEQQCANCMHFIVESNTCNKVEGDISPIGWCVLWSSAT